MGVAAFVIPVGFVSSVLLGRLIAILLDLLYVADVKLNPRTQARIAAHSVLLAEALRETSQDTTGK